jgi:hypothetical protein
MQHYQKQLICGLMLCAGLVNLLLPQYIVAARDWWRQFQEENLDQNVLPDLTDLGLRRRRRDMDASGYRFVGGGLIVFAIVLWWFTPG